MYFDEVSIFSHRIKENIQSNKGIGTIIKLRKTLHRDYLVTIYKRFMVSHLEYGNIIYDPPNNESYNQKIERIQ